MAETVLNPNDTRPKNNQRNNKNQLKPNYPRKNNNQNNQPNNRPNKQNNKMEELSFADSWKQNSVELAVLGSIVLGAGRFGVKGNFNDVAKYSKKTLNQAGKGFERYINKKMSPLSRFLKDNVKQTAKKIKDTKQPTQTESFSEYQDKALSSYKGIPDDVIEKEVKKRLPTFYTDALYKHTQSGSTKPFVFNPDMDLLREEIRTSISNNTLSPKNKKYPKKDGVFVDWKEKAVGSAISGLGFGAGITALHGIDQSIRNNKEDKKRDDTFTYAGSFLTSKDGERMNKQAGTRQLYDGLVEVSKNTPKAVATSLGFTGVSLGTAKLMKEKNKQEKEQAEAAQPVAPKGNRIIIELGDTDPAEQSVADHAYANSGYQGLARTRLASTGENGLSKLSGLIPLKEFGKNVAGRGKDIRHLDDRVNERTINYRDEAAELLKGKDIEAETAKRYGNLITNDAPASKDFYGREFLDSESKKLKQQDVASLETLKDGVARDRMIALGGLVGLGGAGTAIGSLSHKNDRSEQ